MNKIKTASERMADFLKTDEFSKLKNVEELGVKHLQFVQQEIDELRSRISGLEAARIAYANEFELNEEGQPDVGSIHQNIRNLKRETTHWKANHASIKEMLRVATHRTDLPSDRFPIFEQLKAENKKLRIIMMSASKKLNSSEDCSNVPQQLHDAALCNDINFISQDTVRMDYLENMCVEVRTPLRHGSQSLFHAQTVSDDEDPHKNDIRDQIGKHMKNKS